MNKSMFTIERKLIVILFIVTLMLFLIVLYFNNFYENESTEQFNKILKKSNKKKRKLRDVITSGHPKVIKVKQQVYSEMLKRTMKALGKLGIKCFLSSGTCLGYFREGKFIDYDYDIDVGIMASDYNPALVHELAKENINLYRILGNERDGLELSFRMPGTKLGRYAKIDIFLHYRENHNGQNMISWYTYAAPKYIKKVKYRVSAFDLRLVNFADTQVYVPNPTLKYIEEHYGKDWMIPKKPFTEYTYHSSPTSIVKD